MKTSDVVAIVTGGSNGFGRAFSEFIARNGGKVLIGDIDSTTGEKLAAQLCSQHGEKCAAFLPMDVLSKGMFQKAFQVSQKIFGTPVNVLVNNAGIADRSMSFYTDRDHTGWKKMIDINLTSVIEGTQVAVHEMQKHGNGGLIINVASFAGLSGVPNTPVYAASKWGVVGLTRSLSHLRSDCNIRVNALCPSFADTAMGRMAQEQGLKEYIASIGGLIPLERIVQAFQSVVEDENMVGEAIRITSKGFKPHRFTAPKQKSKM